MKRFYCNLILSLVLCAAGLQAQANRVLVKGYVRYVNGNAVVQQRVLISTDSTSNSTCNVYHQKFTDANGFYMDTLECSTNIAKVRISTAGCNGAVLVQDPTVSASAVVEANFTVCNPVTPPPTSCISQFTFERAANAW